MELMDNSIQAKRILYIGGGRDTLETLFKAKELGIYVVLIQKPLLITPQQSEIADETHLVDYDSIQDLVAVARRLHAISPFVTALSLFENSLVAAAHVRDALGLPGNLLETVITLKNKATLRARLEDISLSPVLFREGQSRADIEAFRSEVNGPIIVKPKDAAGSLSVRLVTNASDIDDAFRAFDELGLETFLMEEYLDGPEVSVEAFSFHGSHIVIGVTDKRTFSNFIEEQHLMPSELTAASLLQIRCLTQKFLDAIGFLEGPSHTEIKLTKRGPRIIESHDRIGGDRIHDLIEKTYGIDMKALTFAWFAGLARPMTSSPIPISAAAIRFLKASPGVVTAILGVEEATRDQSIFSININVGVGAQVGELKSSYDRCGYLMACGREPSDILDRVMSQIQIITTPLAEEEKQQKV
jgi:biotin carboxylase